MKTYHKFSEREDNLICTFVKMYRFNVAYGITRASEHTGIRRAIVSNRYYNHLRNTKKIFSVEFGDQLMWNTRSISKIDLENLSKYESIKVEKIFEELDNRVWWKN